MSTVRAHQTYRDEVASLASAYANALGDPDDAAISQVRRILAGENLIAVGVGGTSPLAVYGAHLHVKHFGRSARAVTPLSYLQSDATGDVVLVYSAQVRHPDTEMVIRKARAREQRVVLITQRDPSELGAAYEHVHFLKVAALGGRDGFLATQSVITMATVTSRIYEEIERPSSLPLAGREPASGLRQRLLVLYGADEAPAARDIEVRFEELGLASVQLADYRAFAHGRHVGLSRRMDSTTVIALSSPTSAALSEKTLANLPAATDLRRLSTEVVGSVGTLDLLSATAALPLEAAERAGLNPNRPKVPQFGRSLYHLSYRRSLSMTEADAVVRKLAAFGAPGEAPFKPLVLDAYETWRSQARKVPVRGIVCDYDGTVVDTRARFEAPTEPVQRELVRLLDMGLSVAFASGRGDSLHESLRRWVPQRHWRNIIVGLHNGGWILRLDEAATPHDEHDSALAQAADLAQQLCAHVPGIALRTSSTQVSVESVDGAIALATLRALIDSMLAREGIDQLRVATSGHSVDVSPLAADKTPVIRAMGVPAEELLLIGDQGNERGNDYELLHAAQLSLSVDQSSAALDRCWNVSRAGESGSQSFVRLLGLVRTTGRAHRLSIPRTL